VGKITKTVNNNYSSIASPGSTFNRRISQDSDTFARNDVDALGEALDDHDHSSNKGLAINSIPSGGLTIAGGLTVSTVGATITAGNLGIGTAQAANYGVQFAGSVTAMSAVTASLAMQGTVTAAANSDTLYGVLSANTFNAASHTSVVVYGGYFSTGTISNWGQTGTNGYGVRAVAPTGAAVDNVTLWCSGTPSGGTNNWGIVVDGGGFKIVGTYDFHNAAVANGGGSAPTFGTIGGSGPTTAAQNAWLQVQVAGTNSWIPIWR
jgi:hypothetical protein